MRPGERFLDVGSMLALKILAWHASLLPANLQWLPIFRQLPLITSGYSRPRKIKNSGWKIGKQQIPGLGFPVSNPFSHPLDKNTKIPQCFASYKHDSCFDTEIPSLSEWKIAPLGKQEHGFTPNYHLFYTCHFKNKFLFQKMCFQ